MAPKKKGSATRVSKKVAAAAAAEDLEFVSLQAILLADSFTHDNLQPITLERPKVLFPLLNKPILDYSLSWLQSSGIKQVFLFCSTHSNQFHDYLKKSQWLSNDPNFSVKLIVSRDSSSVGDALRFVYSMDVIRGDFVLVSGNTVANVCLKEVIQGHRERRRKDSNAVMTMVLKHFDGCPCCPKQVYNKVSNLVVGIDPETKELQYYKNVGAAANFRGMGSDDIPGVTLHDDKQDCFIDICSSAVLDIFHDNFDYEDLRRDLIKGLLDDDVMGFKVYTHEIHPCYAARVDNFRSYDAITRDLNHQLYLIGRETVVGDDTEILDSVIGDGCKIGANVSIKGCYIWNNVTIEDGCKLTNAVICDGVVIKSGVDVDCGVVLSFNVVVGPNCTVPAYSKVSLLPQSSNVENMPYDEWIYKPSNIDVLGASGVGHLWFDCEGGDQEVEYDSTSGSECDDNSEDFNDAYIENEVEATILRAVLEGVGKDHLVLELNSLRLAYNMSFNNCAGAVFSALIKLALQSPHSTKSELLEGVSSVITTWGHILQHYLISIDEEIEVILKFEEMCLSQTSRDFAPMFQQILHMLYDKDILSEDAIVNWAFEKEGADESDRIFLKQSEAFIQWLKEAPEEDD